MNPTDETVIELSRTKIVLLVLGACAFVAVGVWLLSVDPEEVRFGRSFRLFFNEPAVVRAAGAASILFFGLLGLYGLRKVFDKRPGLVLNSSGIVDNASAVAAGFIPWSEILGASVYEIQKQKMLIIGVRDPQKYIERGGALKRALNSANYEMSGSPVAISAVTLKIDFSELVSLFERYRQRYGAGRGDAPA